jgi:hypothetical protein
LLLDALFRCEVPPTLLDPAEDGEADDEAAGSITSGGRMPPSPLLLAPRRLDVIGGELGSDVRT